MGRVLAIDYGTRKIGLAISDENRLIVTSLPQIQNNVDLMKNLSGILETYTPELIIIGYPSTDYPEQTPFQKQIIEFQNRLKKICDKQIVLFDESYSSEEAEKIFVQKKGKSKTSQKKLKEKKKQIDSLAAHLFLKTYLDSII